MTAMWPAYVINLARNTVRLANSAAQLGKQRIPFERIDAVDGWKLPESEIARIYDAEVNRRRARRPLVRSEIGCYLSHIDAWRRIAEGPAEGGFVFEDDFRAADDLGEILALLSEVRRDWDMVKLFTLDPDPKCVDRRTLGSGYEIVVPYRIPSCAIGYGLTREVARRLASSAIPFFRAVDEDHKFFWESGLRVALVLPGPVTGGDQQTVTGTIGTERRTAGRGKGVSRLVQARRSFLYQLRYATLLRYHRTLGAKRSPAGGAVSRPRTRSDAVNSAAPKVLHVHFGKDGGAERFFVSLAQALGERGIEQRFVIRPRRTWRNEIEALGPIIENHYRYLSPSRPLLIWQLRRMLRKWRPDAIMAWKPRGARLTSCWPEAVKLARLGDFPRHLKHYRDCDALVGNLPGIGDRCKELGWTRPMSIITNFPPGITARPVVRAVLDTPEDAFLISGAGRFVPRKGFDLLIRAAARIPDAWLWLIGDGEERPALEALAREVGMSGRTRFAGWIEEPIHHIAATDVFGMPSRHEPLGNVILEAWQARVPVVATRSEGPSWYMVDGENGALVDIDDLDAFAAAVGRLQSDRAFAEKLIAGGRARLEKMFSRDRIVDQYLDLFAGDLTGGEA